VLSLAFYIGPPRGVGGVGTHASASGIPKETTDFLRLPEGSEPEVALGAVENKGAEISAAQLEHTLRTEISALAERQDNPAVRLPPSPTALPKTDPTGTHHSR